jgi:YkoY family integral membrane protein
MLSSIFVVLFLCFLEGILSLDNALVLAILVRPLPEAQRKKALIYGMAGAFIFRAVALLFITQLMTIPWIKIVGGGYLILLAGKHFLGNAQEDQTPEPVARSFWGTVLMVELMDIVFSIDSILTAVSISSVYWIIVLGGIMGIIMMRIAAGIFVKLLEKFPNLEMSAYLLIGLVGTKLVAEYWHIDFHSSQSPYTWTFWILVIFSLAGGLLRRKL